jgi:predicted transposase YdaD
MKAKHDSGYKQLFGHPELMLDLLRGFVSYPWVKDLDVSALERINASYVGSNGEQRHDDMVWRLRVGGQCVYVYLLLEFQSTCDYWMALRMQVYTGLLYQDLIKQRKLGRRGKLPPVLPIVLYNGRRRWSASHTLSGLRLPQPEGLAALQPELKYLLIDQSKVATALDDTERNMVAALFALERSRSRQACVEVLRSLARWLQAGSTEPFRDSLLRWLSGCVQRKEYMADFVPEEEIIMGNLTLDQWTASIVREAKQTRKRERAEARALGLAEGRAEGKAAGRAEGRELGRAEALRQMVERLLVLEAGTAPPRLAERIAAAPAPQLEAWIERLLDGAAAQDVFNTK